MAIDRRLLLLAALPTLALAQATPFTDAEVRKIDTEAGKLTLRHAEIPHLDMPPMTMVFGLRDKALLNGLKPGDKIRVQIVREGGLYLVLAVQR